MSGEYDQNDYWKNKQFSFYSHKKCESFPCHSFENTDEFNCLFCYCPLYVLGENCGGNYVYSAGIKDCSNCIVPHKKNNYGYITGKFEEIVAVLRVMEKNS